MDRDFCLCRKRAQVAMCCIHNVFQERTLEFWHCRVNGEDVRDDQSLEKVMMETVSLYDHIDLAAFHLTEQRIRILSPYITASPIYSASFISLKNESAVLIEHAIRSWSETLTSIKLFNCDLSMADKRRLFAALPSHLLELTVGNIGGLVPAIYHAKIPNLKSLTVDQNGYRQAYQYYAHLFASLPPERPEWPNLVKWIARSFRCLRSLSIFDCPDASITAGCVSVAARNAQLRKMTVTSFLEPWTDCDLMFAHDICVLRPQLLELVLHTVSEQDAASLRAKYFAYLCGFKTSIYIEPPPTLWGDPGVALSKAYAKLGVPSFRALMTFIWIAPKLGVPNELCRIISDMLLAF